MGIKICIFTEIGIYSSVKTSLGKDVEYKSTGAIVFTVVGAIIIAGMVTFSVISVVSVIKNRGKRIKRK